MVIRKHDRRPDSISAIVLLAHFFILLFPVYWAAATGPGWHIVLAWLWFGLLAQGALLSLHEAAHKLIFRSVAANEFFAHWLIAPLFFADFDAFRQRHWQHHRKLGEDGDPKYTYRMNISGWRFFIFFLSTITLIEAVRRTIYQAGQKSGSTAESGKKALIALVVTQSAFGLSLASVALVSHPGDIWSAFLSLFLAYGVVYVYGLASLGAFIIALRGIVEHQPRFEGEPMMHGAALRNFENGFIGKWIFAPYGFDDHATHHMNPGVPYYCLPEATESLKAGDYQGLYVAPVGSHFQVLCRIVAG